MKLCLGNVQDPITQNMSSGDMRPTQRTVSISLFFHWAFAVNELDWPKHDVLVSEGSTVSSQAQLTPIEKKPKSCMGPWQGWAASYLSPVAKFSAPCIINGVIRGHWTLWREIKSEESIGWKYTTPKSRCWRKQRAQEGKVCDRKTESGNWTG